MMTVLRGGAKVRPVRPATRCADRVGSGACCLDSLGREAPMALSRAALPTAWALHACMTGGLDPQPTGGLAWNGQP